VRIPLVRLSSFAWMALTPVVWAQGHFQLSHPHPVSPRSAGGDVQYLTTYAYDDGSSETAVGAVDCDPAGPATLLWLHGFDAIGGTDTISCISTAFGTPWFPPNAPPNGVPAGVGLWEDPNDDGDPSDAVFLTSELGAVQWGDTDVFTSVPITPTVVSGKFFVGAWAMQDCAPNGLSQYPGPLDQSDTSSGRAWVAASLPSSVFSPINLSALDIPPVEMDSIGLPGVWLLRAGRSDGAADDASDLDTIGKDFIVAMINHDSKTYTSSITPKFKLLINSDVATTVSVEYPVNSPSFTATANVPAGGYATVELPLAAEQWPVGITANRAVHVFGPDPFTLTLQSKAWATSDAATAIPVDALGLSYIVSDYNSTSTLPADYRSEFIVFATEDDTTVVMTPSQNLAGGFTAGISYSIDLDRGQGFKGQAVGTIGLTGTTLSADKPIGLVNGCRGVQIPGGALAGEKIVEMAVPEEHWGQSFRIANLPLRGTCVYRIVASRDDTQCRINGTNFGSPLDRGQYLQFNKGGDFTISADGPVFVTQYMTGFSMTNGDLGDPSMLNMVPWTQYVPNQSFTTPSFLESAAGWSNGTVTEYQHYATIIAWNADLGSLTLDGVQLPSTDFKQIPGTALNVARKLVANGSHTTSSFYPHGITVESYGYRGALTSPGQARYSSPADMCSDCPEPGMTIAVEENGGSVQLVPWVASVDRGSSVGWNVSNALIHSSDTSSRTATTVILAFLDKNPRAGAWNTTFAVPPPGPEPVAGCIRVRSNAPLGTCSYTLTLLDQWGEYMGSLTGELVVQ